MPVIRLHGPLPGIGMAGRIAVVFPSLTPPENGFPVLWLLEDDGKSAFRALRELPLESLSQKYEKAIIVLEGLHSDYENMIRGRNWRDALETGIPSLLRKTFALSSSPRDQAVLGFGMGGLAAVRLGLRHPESAVLFGAVNADLDPLSPTPAHLTAESRHRLETIYGDAWQSPEVRQEQDPVLLVRKAPFLPPFALYLSEPDSFAFPMHLLERELHAYGGNVTMQVLTSPHPRLQVLNHFLTMLTSSPQQA